MTIDVLSPEFDRRMAAQNKEFDACAKLTEQYRRITLTPVVDDDYSEVRHFYESALRDFIDALQDNDRFPGNVKKSVPVESVANDFMSRLHEQNLSRGKRWRPSGHVSWSLSDWFTAMAGEVGELGNVVKKLNRARDGLAGNKESVGELSQMLWKEAADILIYLELFCQAAGVDLVRATREKFNEVSERNGFPERL